MESSSAESAHDSDDGLLHPNKPTLLVLGHAHEADADAISYKLVERDDLVQTALDVIVEVGGSTVGNVLIGSIPSEPTTVSLPGFGLLTMSGFAPAATTGASMSSSGSAVSPTASASPAPTSFFGPMSTAAVSTNTSSILSTTTALPLPSGLANSTTTSFSNFTTTAFNSSSSFSSSTTTITSTTTSSHLSTTTSTSSATTGANGPFGAPTQPPTTSPSAAPVASSASNNSKAGPIAGGVVGGVAGALIIGLVLFFLVRRRLNRGSNGARLLDPEDGASTAPVSRDGPPPMSQQAPPPPTAPSSTPSPLAPFAAAASRLRPPPAPVAAERGFTRVSGRKLTPVIHSGGDGWSEPAAIVAPHLSTDFSAATSSTRNPLRDSSAAALRGPENKIPGEQAVDESTNAAHEGAVMHRRLQPPSENGSVRALPPSSNRNSAAPGEAVAGGGAVANALRSVRMFASSSPDSFDEAGGSDARTPSPQGVLQQGPQRTPIVRGRGGDAVGRSRPSLDGSRVSRFNEAL